MTAAGLRAKTLRFNARPIDVTDSGSAQAWRELLPGAGVKSAEISGAGIFRDRPSDGAVRTAFFSQTELECQFILPDFGVIDGAFLVSSLSYAGTYQGEASFDISLVCLFAAYLKRHLPIFRSVKMRSEDWPFEAWLTLALRGFGLAPDAFWAMSLRDWLSVTRTDGAQAMRREELSALCLKFPDEVKDDSHKP